MEFLFVVIGTFGFVGGFSLLFLQLKVDNKKDIIQKRLAAISERSPKANGQLLTDSEKTFWEQTTSFFLGDKELPERYTVIGRTLHQAGYSGEREMRIVWGVCICSTI